MPTPSTILYDQTHAPMVPVLIVVSSIVFTLVLMLR